MVTSTLWPLAGAIIAAGGVKMSARKVEVTVRITIRR